MTEHERGSDRLGRRAKRFLTPLQKYEIWLQLVRGETTIAEAADRYGARSVGIAGGVSANARLRKDFADRAARLGLPAYVPALSLSTDNAAMIAAAGLRNFHAGKRAGMDLNADPSLEL